MPNQLADSLADFFQRATDIDDERAADDNFKLPLFLRAALDRDRPAVGEKGGTVEAEEGDRAAAVKRRRGALTEIEADARGGFRFLEGIDRGDITAADRLKAMDTYGWTGGRIGDALEGDDAVLANARLAVRIGAAELPNPKHRYPTALVDRIKAQLLIVDGNQDDATGGGRQAATRARNVVLTRAQTTASRIRHYYCCASEDADQTPELARLGLQPRRDPGEVDHPVAPPPAGGGPAPAADK